MEATSLYSAESDAILRETVERLYADLGRDDADWAPGTVAEDAASLVIGSDPDEWWQGHGAICAAWAKAKAEYGGTALSPTRLAINRLGDIAWVTDEPSYSVEGGRSRGTLRLTLIFVRTPNRWRLVHLHASAPVSNSSLLE